MARCCLVTSALPGDIAIRSIFKYNLLVAHLVGRSGQHMIAIPSCGTEREFWQEVELVIVRSGDVMTTFPAATSIPR
jgi:hypothetical protein